MYAQTACGARGYFWAGCNSYDPADTGRPLCCSGDALKQNTSWQEGWQLHQTQHQISQPHPDPKIQLAPVQEREQKAIVAKYHMARSPSPDTTSRPACPHPQRSLGADPWVIAKMTLGQSL